mmetsp:Transcript_38833/g.62227  ORF Transcript_38833/g.62227 Transcript_38833/m.62227 type:complete len:290 (+) Transcript_38833:27-896(+)
MSTTKKTGEGFPMAFKGPGLFQANKEERTTSGKTEEKQTTEEKPDKHRQNSSLTNTPALTRPSQETKTKVPGFPLKFSGPGLFSKDGNGAQKCSIAGAYEEHVGHSTVIVTSPEASQSASENPKEFKRTIFVCLDRSKFAIEVLEWCVRTVFQATDKVVFVHVNLFRPMHMDLYPSLSLDYAKENERIYNAAVHEGTRFLKAIVAKSMRLGRRPDEYKLLLGSKNTNSEKHAILQCVNRHVPDFVIVGSRGMGAMGRMFLGSTSDYLAHNAKCPVLIVRCKDKKDEIEE